MINDHLDLIVVYNVWLLKHLHPGDLYIYILNCLYNNQRWLRFVILLLHFIIVKPYTDVITLTTYNNLAWQKSSRCPLQDRPGLKTVACIISEILTKNICLLQWIKLLGLRRFSWESEVSSPPPCGWMQCCTSIALN